MATSSDSIVDRVYEQLKSMAVNYEFRPGERLNEGDIARKLGVSRTPLREALNRLNTEGFLRFAPGKGFYCRELDPREIFDLYELRKSIETSAARFAVERAKKEDIDALLLFLEQTADATGHSTSELVQFDEEFHERLMFMSGNAEMLRVLRNINARIRFVRWIDMDRGSRPRTQAEHRNAALALRARDEVACVSILESHINRRLDQITSAIKEGYAQIYMGSGAPRD
jgi:DNA-binding GntR family transcriptional regulator